MTLALPPKNEVVVDNANDQIEVSIDVSGTSTEQFVIKDGVLSQPQITTSNLFLATKSSKTCTLMALHT